MIENEVIGKIVTGLLTAIVSVAVCLINNAVQLKRDRQARDDKVTELLTNQTASIRSDFMAHLQEMIANQQLLSNEVSLLKKDVTHDIGMLQYQFQELGKSVEKHNGIVDRTYKLEERVGLTEEKIRVANHRIDDLEDGRK